MDVPVFSCGCYAQDQGPRGKVVDYRVPVEMEGTRIEPGDFIFGDMDGVTRVDVVPSKTCWWRRLKKARAERTVKC